MYTDAEQAFEALNGLGLPPLVADIWEGRAPGRISIQFRRPTRFFRGDAAVPDKEFCVPILERNRETILAFNLRDRAYLVHYYGDPNPELSGATFQQLVAWMLVELGYAGLEDVALELASSLKFERTGSFLEFLRVDDGTDPQVAKLKFVASVGKGHAS